MKKTILSVWITALALSLHAGDWGKAPVDKSPIEECVDLGGEISVGYDTDYVFYGVRFAGDSVWTDVNYTFDNLAVPVTVGVWYLNGINGGSSGYDEINLYASAEIGTFAGFDATIGYLHYAFPEYRGSVANTGGYGEGFIDLSRDLGFAKLTLGTVRSFGGDGTSGGWYHQVGFERSFDLTERVALVLGTGIGYSDGFHTVLAPPNGDSGWNHYFVTASLPITLNCRTTLTPYIGYLGATSGMVADGIDAGLDPQSDILHGGVSLTVSF